LSHHHTDSVETQSPAKDRFEQLLEFAPDAVLGVGRTGLIDLVNSQVEQIFGYSRDELIGQRIEKLIPERLHDLHESHRSGYFANPRMRSMGAGLELHARRKDGSEFPCEISLSSIETDDGRVALAAVRDVTERHQAEDQFRQLLEFAPDAVLGVGQAGLIELVNSQVEQIFGYERDELIGERIEKLIPERFHPVHEGHRAGYFSNPRTRSMGAGLELHARRKDGSEFPCEISLSSIPTDEGRVALAAVRDVTERHQAEEELRQTSEQLARSNADLEQFAYVASHDLSEPLRTVTGFVQLLADRHAASLDDEAREFIAFATGGTARMQELLDGLLAYSRAGMMEQTPGAVDCAHTVERVLAGLTSSITEAGAEILVGDLPVVVADPTQLEQLFQNLLANALKFRGSEAARIEVSAERTPAGYVFSIADHGIGIEPQYREQIFKMFTRLHSRDAYSGIGAGLAICRQIAIRNGGRIWVDETPGGGSTFRFELRSSP